MYQCNKKNYRNIRLHFDSKTKQKNIWNYFLNMFACVILSKLHYRVISEFIKNILIVFQRWATVLQVVMTWWWVINDRIVIFGLNYPFNDYSKCPRVVLELKSGEKWPSRSKIGHPMYLLMSQSLTCLLCLKRLFPLLQGWQCMPSCW